MTEGNHQAETRRWLIDRYRETGDEIYLRLAQRLRKSSSCLDAADILLAEDRLPANRPEKDDFAVCLQMALLILERGVTRWAAARQMAKETAEIDGTDEHSLASRYDRKFKAKQDLYFGQAIDILAAKMRRQAIEDALDNSPVIRIQRVFHKTQQKNSS